MIKHYFNKYKWAILVSLIIRFILQYVTTEQIEILSVLVDTAFFIVPFILVFELVSAD